MIAYLYKYFSAIAILYLVIAVFIARDHVVFVYLASALLAVITVYLQLKNKPKSLILLAQWMITLAVIGLSAATILSIEKIALLSEPDRIASCSVSPVVACSPVIASEQASVFGFANSLIGIFAFACVFTAGITLLSGAAKLNKQWWQTLNAGVLFGAIFSSWLIYQGVYEIGKLCLYCLLVWLVSFALFWLITSYNVDNKHLNLGARLNKLARFKYELIATTYAIIAMIIFARWSDYWLSLF